jgi:hypothetical protein
MVNPWAEAGPQGREMQRLDNAHTRRQHELHVLRRLQVKIGRIPPPDPSMTREERKAQVWWYKLDLESFMQKHRKVLARMGIGLETFLVPDNAVKYRDQLDSEIASRERDSKLEEATTPSLFSRCASFLKGQARKLGAGLRGKAA